VIPGVIEGRLGGQDSIRVEPRNHGSQVDERADENTSGGQQHDGQSDLSCNQRLPQAHGASSDDAATGDRRAQLDFPRGQGRQHAEEHAGQQGEDEGEAQDAGIERNVGDRQKVRRQKEQQRAQGEKAHTDASSSTDEGQ
jgi:hypothetical protein